MLLQVLTENLLACYIAVNFKQIVFAQPLKSMLIDSNLILQLDTKRIACLIELVPELFYLVEPILDLCLLLLRSFDEWLVLVVGEFEGTNY